VNQIYRYTGVWTEWLTLSALYGKVESQYTDYGQNLSLAYVADQRTSSIKYLTSVTNPGPFNLDDKDVRETYRADADLYFNLLGSHHVRIGMDQEQLLSSDASKYSSGCYYQIRGNSRVGPPPGSTYAGDYIRRTCLNQGGKFHGLQGAYYFEDTWQPTEQLTLQIGIRDDNYSYKTAADEQFIKMNGQFAPRLGATYDVFGDGNDKAMVSFGRYYLPIAENTAIRMAAAAPFWRDYWAIPTVGGVDTITLDSATGAPTLGASVAPVQTFAGPNAPDAKMVASQNLSPMYTREFSIGWEHSFDQGLLKDWSFGLTYVDRNLASTIEDSNLQNVGGGGTGYGDGAIGRFCQRTGISAADCQTDAYEGMFTLINPGKDAVVWIDPDGKGARYVTLSKEDLGLPRASNHYQAIQLTFQRPFDGTWGLQGSYVFSRSYGNYEGAVKSDIGQTDTSITQDFDTPYVIPGATGYLPNHHAHTFKIFGSYSPFEGLMIGGNVRLQSGRPYGCIGYNPDDPNPSPSPSEWFCYKAGSDTSGTLTDNHNVLTPRGASGETPWTSTVDLSIAYQLPLQMEAVTSTVYFDAFNVFNSQTTTRVVEQGDVGGSAEVAMQTYGWTRSRQAPRSFRFGVRVGF
jgi:hypothetical protein